MTICILKKEVISFGGTIAWIGNDIPPHSTYMLSFGGLNVNHLAHDVMEKTRV
jgi:hypothetical protein